MGFLSFGNSYVKLSDNLFDSPYLKSVVSLLGIDKTFSKIWGNGGSAATAEKTTPIQETLNWSDADSLNISDADLQGAKDVTGINTQTDGRDPATNLPVATIDGQKCVIGSYGGTKVALKADPAVDGRYEIMQADGTWSSYKAIYFKTDGNSAMFVDKSTWLADVKAGTFDTPLSEVELSTIYEEVGAEANAEITEMTDMSGTETAGDISEVPSAAETTAEARVRTHLPNQKMTVAAKVMAPMKMSAHRSYRVAMRRQSLSLANRFSIG